jgi:hypothetical protein
VGPGEDPENEGRVWQKVEERLEQQRQKLEELTQLRLALRIKKLKKKFAKRM